MMRYIKRNKNVSKSGESMPKINATKKENAYFELRSKHLRCRLPTIIYYLATRICNMTRIFLNIYDPNRFTNKDDGKKSEWILGMLGRGQVGVMIFVQVSSFFVKIHNQKMIPHLLVTEYTTAPILQSLVQYTLERRKGGKMI